MTSTNNESRREIWEADGIPAELGFWRAVMDGIVGKETKVQPKVIERMARRLQPNRPLQDYPRSLVEASAVANATKFRVLDAGAGPFSQLGHAWPGHDLELVATDALADHYDTLIAEYELAVPIRTRRAEFERLDELFEADTFDLVWSQNSLDHSYDPACGIEQMLRVAKPGSYVSIMMFESEAKRENYQGMHQWYFEKSGNDVSVTDQVGNRFMVSELIAGKAELERVGYVRYFSDDDSSGIVPLSQEFIDAAKSRKPPGVMWLQFLIKKNS